MCAPSPFLVCSLTPFCAPPSSFQWGKFSVTPRKPEGWRVKAGMERGPSRDWEGRWTKAERLGAGAGQPHTPQKAWKAGASISSLWRVLRKFGGGALGSLLFWEGERTAASAGLGAVTFRPRLRLRAGSAGRGQRARRRAAWRDWSCSTLWPPGYSSCCTRWLESGE